MLANFKSQAQDCSMTRWRHRQSRREQLLANNQADAYYAAMAGVEPKAQNVIVPKRERRSKVPTASEHQLQASIISWWAHTHNLYALPEFALLAIPNGGARDAITGSRLKAEGVRPGVPDLLLAKPVGPYTGLWVELKVGYNKPSDAQFAFIAYLESVGYKASVHWDADSAIKAIEDYLRDERVP